MHTPRFPSRRAASLLSTLMLAWSGCEGPPPPAPDEDETARCEAPQGCEPLISTSACFRVHQWDIWQFGTNQDDTGVVVSSDDECNVYVAGNTRGRFSGGGTGLNTTEAGAAQDIFSVRLPSVVPSDGTDHPNTSFPEPRLTQLGSSADDSVKDFAVAEDKSVYLVGTTAGQLPGAILPGRGFNDSFVLKLRSAGTRAWTQQYGSPEEDAALAVALHGQGVNQSVYVAGTTQADVSRGFDITLDKVNPSTGALLTQATYGTPEHDRAEGLAIDSAGNLFLVGSTMGDYSGPDAHAGSTDAFVSQLSPPNFAEESWKSQVATPDIDAALDAVVDGQGNLYVLAVSFSDLDEGWSENDGIQNSFLIKYAPGTSRPEWTKRIGTKSQYSRATGMALDANNKVYVAGFTVGSIQNGVQNKGLRDAFVARFNDYGDRDWTRQLGTSANDEAADVVVTKAGDVIITGFTSGSFPDFQNQGRQDVFLARFPPPAP